MSDDNENTPSGGGLIRWVFSFREHSITYIEWRGERVWIAREIGRAMGYSDDGRQLVKNITQRWGLPSAEGATPRFRLGEASKVGLEDMDGFRLEGENLSPFKEMTRVQSAPSSDSKGGQSAPPWSIDPRINSLLMLTESGLYNAIGSAQTSAANEFRHFINSKVLPTINGTGTYTLDADTPPELLSSSETSLLLQLEVDKEDRLQRVVRDRVIGRILRAVEKLEGLKLDRAIRVALLSARRELPTGDYRELKSYLEAFLLRPHLAGAQNPIDFGLTQRMIDDAALLPLGLQLSLGTLTSEMRIALNPESPPGEAS